ncbi:MAG TPA: polyprenyl synthetase family protein [Spirochaetes bacterium]|nr:polyprenyl synthetase family protein [Spirochaetota bacterium]
MRKQNIKKNERNMFLEYANQYSPEIDMSIGKFFQKKKKSVPRGFMRDIYEILGHYCLRKGKRVRPVMLIIGYLGYGGKKSAIGGVVALASALELMHCFLLIQDDIIDRAEERRGDRALHLVFQDKYGKVSRNDRIGQDVALVAADVLFTCALEIITAAPVRPELKQEFMALFSKTYEMTAWGQILDSLHTLPTVIPAGGDTARQISLMKTAYYTVYYPLLMGYVLAGGNSENEKKLIEQSALPMGLAFQLRDDILGTFGEKEKTGKPTVSDIVEGKLTHLVQHTLINLDEKEKNRFFGLFSSARKSSREIAEIKKILMQSGALDEVVEHFRREVGKAGRGIEKLAADKTAKSALRGFIGAMDLPIEDWASGV